MNRRRFLNTVALAGLVQPSKGDVEVEVIRPKSPFDALLRDIEPGHDEFPLEKRAADIVSQLRELFRNRTLPLARHWLDSLGPIRSARFFVLPGDKVRFEIAAATKYLVGTGKPLSENGRVIDLEPIEETVTSSPQPLFQDVTGHAFRNSESFDRQLRCGVNYWRSRLDSATGIDVHGHNGIAVGDLDGDGLDAVYICQPGGLPNRLYRNKGDGSFEDITERAGVGVLDATSSALFLDLRNSGLQDLVVLRPEGPLLFINEGQSRFRPQPGAFQFRTAPQGSFTGMAAADYDRDGRLDLYLCTYSFFRDGGQYRYPSPYYDARNGPANYLFRNNLTQDGAGSFVDVTDASGLNHNNSRFSFAPAWCDYNGDGWPDLYVANDFGRNNLYRNENGRFRDVAAEAGVEDPGDGMSASWFDYDGDGRPDLYVSNMWSDAGQRIIAEKNLQPKDLWRRHAKGNSLFRSKGDGTFEETGAAEGVEMGRWAWSSGGFDFDNDGQPEIFIATGMLTNDSETDLESFFWRKVAAASPARYEDGWNALSQAVHEKYSEAGRQPNVFYVRREGRYQDFSGVSGLDSAEDGRAFAVTDLDGDGNLDLILKNRTGPQVRVFRNQSTKGRRSIAFRLRGVQSNRDAIGARVTVDGQTKFIEAGSGYLSQHTKVLYFGVGDLHAVRSVGIAWPSGLVQRFENCASGHIYQVTEGDMNLTAKPFRASAAMQTTEVIGNNSTQPADTWLFDPVPLPENVKGPTFLKVAGPNAAKPALYAAFCRQLFDLRRDLKAPAWLLVDERSRARKIVFSSPDPNDLKLLDRSLALPFPGKFYTRPTRNYAALGAALANNGYSEQALPYLTLASPENDKVLFAIGRIHLIAGRWPQAQESLEKGLKLSPLSADGWNNLGSVKAARGQFRDAIEAYQRALALRPDMAAAMVNAGQAWVAIGDPARAEHLFHAALQANPGDAAAANQLGELCAKQQHDSEARKWFEKSIANRRDYTPAISNLGALYLRAGQPNDAVAAFRYGISVAPDEETFYLNLANIFAAVGDSANAKQTVEALLLRHPDNKNALQTLRTLEAHARN